MLQLPFSSQRSNYRVVSYPAAKPLALHQLGSQPFLLKQNGKHERQRRSDKYSSTIAARWRHNRASASVSRGPPRRWWASFVATRSVSQAAVRMARCGASAARPRRSTTMALTGCAWVAARGRARIHVKIYHKPIEQLVNWVKIRTQILA